jgi:hypothetical protein
VLRQVVVEFGQLQQAAQADQIDVGLRHGFLHETRDSRFVEHVHMGQCRGPDATLLEVGDQGGGAGRIAAREQRIGVILAGAQHSAENTLPPLAAWLSPPQMWVASVRAPEMETRPACAGCLDALPWRQCNIRQVMPARKAQTVGRWAKSCSAVSALIGAIRHSSMRAPGGPRSVHSTSASSAAGTPHAKASTEPSRRLRTQPVRPSRRASTVMA